MKPSLSTGERAEACATSHVLPRVLVTTDAADIGTDIHNYLKVVAPNPAAKTQALERLPPELRDRCAAIDIPAALSGLTDVRTETAYAINVLTGDVRFIGADVAREYGELGPYEIAGALDVDALLDALPVAVDWKTGRGEVTPPDENMQIGAQAYALARFRGVDAAVGRLAFIDDAGGITVVEHHFNALDLAHVLHRWRTTLERVRAAEVLVAGGGVPTVRMGAWCRYCPGRPHCPAIVGFAKAMLGELEADKLGLEMLSPEAQGEAWLRAKAAIAIAESNLEGLKLIAPDAPIPLPDGKEVRPVMSSRTGVNVKRALEMLRERGARDEDLAELHYTTKFPQFRAVRRRA